MTAAATALGPRIPLDEWPQIAEVIPKPWRHGSACTDLRWWIGQQEQDLDRRGVERVDLGAGRIGYPEALLVGGLPGRPTLAKRWGWQDWAVRKLLADVGAWRDEESGDPASDNAEGGAGMPPERGAAVEWVRAPRWLHDFAIEEVARRRRAGDRSVELSHEDMLLDLVLLVDDAARHGRRSPGSPWLAERWGVSTRQARKVLSDPRLVEWSAAARGAPPAPLVLPAPRGPMAPVPALQIPDAARAVLELYGASGALALLDLFGHAARTGFVPRVWTEERFASAWNCGRKIVVAMLDGLVRVGCVEITYRAPKGARRPSVLRVVCVDSAGSAERPDAARLDVVQLTARAVAAEERALAAEARAVAAEAVVRELELFEATPDALGASLGLPARCAECRRPVANVGDTLCPRCLADEERE